MSPDYSWQYSALLVGPISRMRPARSYSDDGNFRKDGITMREVAPEIYWNAEDYRIDCAAQHFWLSGCAARIFSTLVEHPNYVIGESPWLATGWPGQIRGRDDLYRQIHNLRRILELDPRHPCWLRTRRPLDYDRYSA